MTVEKAKEIARKDGYCELIPRVYLATGKCIFESIKTHTNIEHANDIAKENDIIDDKLYIFSIMFFIPADDKDIANILLLQTNKL